MPRVVIAILASWFVVGELHNTLLPSLPTDALFHGYPQRVAHLIAILLVLLRGTGAGGAERWGWLSLGVGLLCWWSGDLYWFLAGEEEVPVPSWGDVGYLAFVPFALAGMGVLASARLRTAPRALWADALVAALAAAAVSTAMFFDPIAAQAEGADLEVATNLAYPIADLALLAVVIGVLALRGWRLERTWILLGGGVVAFWVADSMYLLTSADDSYEVGLWFDLGWFLASVLFAAAAWLGPIETVEEDPYATGCIRLTVMPVLFAVASLALLVVSGWRGSSGLAVALAGASLAVVLVRLVDANRLNAMLLHATRAEARTDALTGLGNRRALADDLDVAVLEARPDRPVHLALFDLDGFKHYNDTFGHPAGDSLLSRLGGNLEQAVEARGRAYRVGGDEFCVLWTEATWRVDLDSAIAALSERGEGFTIGASHGLVAVPAEASGVADVLQLADQRMYAAKRGGRPPAGRQSANILLRVLAERAPELAEHTDQVAELADAVAAQLGLPGEQQRNIRHAAQLHDVGKVAIPDAILSKPGPLSDQEWTFMREHTVIGERIVAEDPALASVAKLVRSSHERWDGDGYPDGLAGHDIAIGARIVAVCDAFDAMITDRPYRTAMGVEEAFTELAACAGKQFDPTVVVALSEVWKRSAARLLQTIPARHPSPVP